MEVQQQEANSQQQQQRVDSFSILVNTQTERDRIRGVANVNAFYLRLLDLVVSLGLLAWQQVSFYPTWNDSCDYNIKVWATVWLSVSCLRSLLGALLLTTGKLFGLLQFILELFQFVWFLYGINPLFTNRPNGEWCNRVSKGWGLFGWILQAITFFFPCFLFICCVPCFLCLTRFQWIRNRLLPWIIGPSEPSTNQTPTPDGVLSKLVPMTYAHAIANNLIDTDAVSQSSEVTKSILTLGGGFGHAMNSLMTRLNSNSQPESHEYIPARNTCPICVTEFTPDDEILLLPCDPRKHIYHNSCIREWLTKSQHCPMCRQNLVDIIQRETGPPPS